VAAPPMSAPIAKKTPAPAPPADFGVSSQSSSDGSEAQAGGSMMLSVAAMVVALLSFGSVFMVYSSVPKPPEEVAFRKPSKDKAGAPTATDSEPEPVTPKADSGTEPVAPKADSGTEPVAPKADSAPADAVPEKPPTPPSPAGDAASPAPDAAPKPASPAPENQ
jgi:hypothetical protein